ncbi:hypothetical protein CC86DRAFT_398577 [Ophiobolus disseminans]|uniref:Transcription initiation factor TFIID subunit 12 domain-containing protein n=1 Tax=Ophiobolus disseminans TaxID=1469910 RepID=A0A6A6ZH25_9PLEO|nr:hypothetical protein CC86DRAFT_398577 [Ophiobolus disseminans]
MASEQPPSNLRILSLNCWGLKFIAKLRNERLEEIGNQIAASDPRPDIVGLQECWTQEDYNVIREKTRHFLPYGKFYWSGIFGGGLVILSRWPIEESNMVRYPLNGRPAAFYRGDWFVGKGVACARIRIGPGPRDIAEVFCTHLHAPYESEPHDSYICHRTAQAWEITKLMRAAAERGHLVIGLGDFNMIPLSLAHRIVETHSPVRDVWRILHPESSVGAARDKVEQLRGVPMPTANFNLTENGATCDSELNSWRWNQAHRKRLAKGENVQIDPAVEDPNAKRLDYIFFSSGRYHDADTGEDSAEWELEDVNVGMTMRHPTLHCSLSDHFSVEATLIRGATSSSAAHPSLVALPERYLPIETYDEILAATLKYEVRERVQRKLRIGHFFYQLSLSVGCLIGVWWSPHNYVSFILMLLSTVGMSVGVIDGLMGFLFVGSEMRALKEFEWEPLLSPVRQIARMSDSQPQQAQGGQQQPQQLLRADDILKLQCLPEDEKQKYRLIMMNFWNISNNNPAGSTEHTTARQKLVEWSTKFIYRERQYRTKQKQMQQQGGQGQASQGNQPPPQNQGAQQNQAQVKVEQPQALQRAAEEVTAPQQSQPQQPGQGQPQQQPGQAQAGPRPGPQPLNDQLARHVQEFPIHLPPQNAPPFGSADYEAKIKDYRQGYMNLLVKQAGLAENTKKIKLQIEERQRNGVDVPQDMLMMRARGEKEYANTKGQVDNFRKLQSSWKAEKERQQAQQGQGQQASMDQVQAQHSAQSPPQQPMQLQQPPQRQLSQSNMHMQTQIKEEQPQIKIEGGQVPQAQPAAQFNMQGNQQQPPQSMQMPPSQQQARPPPAPHSQSMPPNQAQQFAPPGQQQHHMQQNRPQINPHQANAHQHQNSNSPHPQSATSNAPGPPVPLSHQAAVSAANRSYTDPQRTNTPLQQGGQGNFGSRERELNNPKMPIPRHLNVTSPAPVHMGQARPTMSGPTNGAPGPMGQPVIPRPPPFQLEGEGDRVLSKRKLDELVRQVTGGSEEALTSEVEEAVLQLADDFVDNVIGSACKLAKLRESPQLEIRDLQLILERNYNIRIPGYASDEVRTVRKVVPAAGWVDKMKAVNAAKVMGGKTD